MLLEKRELLLCLYARGFTNIMEFQDLPPDMTEKNVQDMKKHLLEQKLLEENPREGMTFRFSAYGQVIIDTVGKPEVWVDIHHLKHGIRRSLFLSGAFYVCVEERGDEVLVDVLPSLPIFIGGYASLLRDLRQQSEVQSWDSDAQLVRISLHGKNSRRELEIDEHGTARQTDENGETFVCHTQQSCTNAITDWVLNALRQREEGSL